MGWVDGLRLLNIFIDTVVFRNLNYYPKDFEEVQFLFGSISHFEVLVFSGQKPYPYEIYIITELPEISSVSIELLNLSRYHIQLPQLH